MICMENQYCTHCGSKYTTFNKKEESVDSIAYVFYCESCKKEFTIRQKVASSSNQWLMTIKDDVKEAAIYKSGSSFTVVQKEYGKSIRKNMTPEVRVHDCRHYGTTWGDPYVIWLSTFTYLNDETGLFIPLRDIELNDELTESALNNPAMKAIHTRGNKFACRNAYANRLLLDDIVAWFDQVLYVPRSETSTSSGGCYIATCVYGSYNCPPVWTLRRFRDNILAATWYGRGLIRTYYAISPTLVKWFGDTKWFKFIWGKVLNKMVGNLQKKGVESTPYCDKIW